MRRQFSVKTLKDTDTILIGGMDREFDYRELIEYLSRSPRCYIILMEATGKRIFKEIAADYPDFENPSDAVGRASEGHSLSCQEGYKACTTVLCRLQLPAAYSGILKSAARNLNDGA